MPEWLTMLPWRAGRKPKVALIQGMLAKVAIMLPWL